MKQTKVLTLLLQNQFTKDVVFNALYTSYNLIIKDHQPSTHYEQQYYELTATLQALIINQISQQKAPSNFAEQAIKLKWKNNFGMTNSNTKAFILDSNISDTDRKITNYEHHLYLLKILKSKKPQHVIQIKEFTQPSKYQQKYLQIQQEKAIPFEQQDTNYVKENFFFNAYPNNIKTSFLTDTIKAIIELNQLNINHNDITFRNFLFSIKYKCWKVIDFDVACNYGRFFEQFPDAECFNQEKLRQSCPQSISSEGMYIRKSNQLIGIFSYTKDQLTQLLKNYQKFYEKNVGKRDAIMYGLMILKLLYNRKNLEIDQSLQRSIYVAVGRLVKTYQQHTKNGKSMPQQQFTSKILNNNFQHKYSRLVQLIFKNLMTRSCQERKRLAQIAYEWNQIVQKIAVYQSVSTSPGENFKFIKKERTIEDKIEHSDSYFKEQQNYITPYDSSLSCFSEKGNQDKFFVELNQIQKKKSSQIKQQKVF